MAEGSKTLWVVAGVGCLLILGCVVCGAGGALYWHFGKGDAARFDEPYRDDSEFLDVARRLPRDVAAFCASYAPGASQGRHFRIGCSTDETVQRQTQQPVAGSLWRFVRTNDLHEESVTLVVPATGSLRVTRQFGELRRSSPRGIDVTEFSAEGAPLARQIANVGRFLETRRCRELPWVTREDNRSILPGVSPEQAEWLVAFTPSDGRGSTDPCVVPEALDPDAEDFQWRLLWVDVLVPAFNANDRLHAMRLTPNDLWVMVLDYTYDRWTNPNE